MACHDLNAYIAGEADIVELANGGGSNVYVIKILEENGERLWVKSLG